MLTVRFASGLSIQYNDANSVVRNDNGYTDLYTAADASSRRWIAQVPTATCVVERAAPCRVYNANLDGAETAAAFEQLIASPASRSRVSANTLARIKRTLAQFDSRSRSWK